MNRVNGKHLCSVTFAGSDSKCSYATSYLLLNVSSCLLSRGVSGNEWNAVAESQEDFPRGVSQILESLSLGSGGLDTPVTKCKVLV